MLDLKDVLSKHKMWLNHVANGIRANLSGAYLYKADLRRVNLNGANLSGAYLNKANLCGANLCGADLCGADLRFADLSEADLRGANLYGANLRYTNLSVANLYGANLRYTNLSVANLRFADLSEADLSGANLYGANLRYTNLSVANLYGANLCGSTDLRGAVLRGAKNTNSVLWSMETLFYPLQCPETGSFIGYKKSGNTIIKLEICEDALRSSATSRKCRCSKAKVISFETLDGEPVDLLEVSSNHDSNFVYRIGETVEVDDFDTDRWNECSAGIHFFITRDEAVKYGI